LVACVSACGVAETKHAFLTGISEAVHHTAITGPACDEWWAEALSGGDNAVLQWVGTTTICTSERGEVVGQGAEVALSPCDAGETLCSCHTGALPTILITHRAIGAGHLAATGVGGTIELC